MKIARGAWLRKQATLAQSRLVFLDECATNTKMARLHGRSKRGERRQAPSLHPHAYWRTTTSIAGLTAESVIAPKTMDGAMKSERFVEYGRNERAPCPWPGVIAILDTPSAHQPAAARKAVEQAGATLLFPPPDAPDFNPIEKAINQIKVFPKKARSRCRNRESRNSRHRPGGYQCGGT